MPIDLQVANSVHPELDNVALNAVADAGFSSRKTKRYQSASQNELAYYFQATVRTKFKKGLNKQKTAISQM